MTDAVTINHVTTNAGFMLAWGKFLFSLALSASVIGVGVVGYGLYYFCCRVYKFIKRIKSK